MTKSDKLTLQRMAEELPRLQRSQPDGSPKYRWQPRKGQELLNNGVNEDRQGHPIAANKTYWFKEPVMVNHMECLMVAYDAGGMAQCEKYCAEVREFIAKSKRPRPWWQRMAYTALLRMGLTTAAMRAQANTINLMKPIEP